MLKRTSKQLSMFSSLEDMLSHEHPLSNLVIRLIGNVLKNAFSPLYCSNNGRPCSSYSLDVWSFNFKTFAQCVRWNGSFSMERECLLPIFLWWTWIYAQTTCDASELVHFRNRIGEKGMELILAESIRVNTDHDNKDHFDRAFIDSTVQ